MTLLLSAHNVEMTFIRRLARMTKMYGKLAHLQHSSYSFPCLACTNTHTHIYITTDKVTYCESLAMKNDMLLLLDLPAECRNMESVQKVLQQKRAAMADPFAGMSGAHKVKGNYMKGQETHHQIQRRLTTGATIGQRRFSKLDK